MRKSLVLALMLTVGSAAPVAGQSYYEPQLFRPAAPPGPRVELDQVRAEIRWIDYLFRRAGQGDVLMSTGTNHGQFSVEGIMAISLPALRESYLKAAEAGVVHPNGLGSMLAYWLAASRENRDKLAARRSELVKRESGLVALIRPSTSPALQPWELGRPPEAKQITCVAEGVWSNTAQGRGSSIWTIAADGKATESGMGNARGTASLSGDTLTITWRTGAVAGVYEIDVFSNCSGGDGTLRFTDGPPGFDRRSGPAEFTRVSGPGGAPVSEGPSMGGVPKN